MTIDVAKLKDSKQFLNMVLENMDAAIFVVDENLKIFQFNDSFLTLFNPGFNDISQMTFGPASGCINAVKENRPCGETSHCNRCIFRQSLKHVLSQCVPNERQALEREFYINGEPVQKYLEFTCRPIEYDGHRMILAFIYDVTKIELSKRQLREKQQQIDIDLEKAGEIQRSLLPERKPDIPMLDVEWFFQPSHKVGGDVFHIYRESDEVASAYMLDVSGHGVSAALVAVMVKQFLDHLHIKGLRNGQPYQPRAVLKLLDQQFPFERFDSYLTIISLLLNVRTGQLIYGCAGHVPPVIIRQNGDIDVLSHHGGIIGIGQNANPQQYDVFLSPRDKLVLYTDGLVDYFGKKGEVSNIDSFYKTLQSLGTQSVAQMVKQVVSHRHVKGGGAPADDISLLVLEYSDRDATLGDRD